MATRNSLRRCPRTCCSQLQSAVGAGNVEAIAAQPWHRTLYSRSQPCIPRCSTSTSMVGIDIHVPKPFDFVIASWCMSRARAAASRAHVIQIHHIFTTYCPRSTELILTLNVRHSFTFTLLLPTKKNTACAHSNPRPATFKKQKVYGPQGLVSNLTT